MVLVGCPAARRPGAPAVHATAAPEAWAAATGPRAAGPIPPPLAGAAPAGAAEARLPPPTIEVASVTATAWSATRRTSGSVSTRTARTAPGSRLRLASRYSTVEASSQYAMTSPTIRSSDPSTSWTGLSSSHGSGRSQGIRMAGKRPSQWRATTAATSSPRRPRSEPALRSGAERPGVTIACLLSDGFEDRDNVHKRAECGPPARGVSTQPRCT